MTAVLSDVSDNGQLPTLLATYLPEIGTEHDATNICSRNEKKANNNTSVDIRRDEQYVTRVQFSLIRHQ
jgi:hypothetical protein